MFRVYTLFTYHSQVLRDRITDLITLRPYDLVHADSLDLSSYFDLFSDLPLVCVHHDLQSRLLRRRARFEGSLLRRSYLRVQAHLMRQEERRWAPQVDLNITVSSVDQEALQELVPGATVAVVPNGVDTAYFQATESVPKHEDGLVCVGGTSWYPNQDALAYLVNEILPEIRRNRPYVPVKWVGNVSAREQGLYRQVPNLELTGWVSDVRPYIQEARCYVVPLRAGSGTRVKILDAWSMGKAVVSTSIGCEGLKTRDGENILIRDDPKDFAEAVVRVLEDAHLATNLGRHARQTVLNNYSWRAIGENMIAQYSRVSGCGKSP